MSDQATREEIERLAEKLEAFAAGLDDRERDLLSHVLDKAAGESDVAGFALSSPLSTSLNTSLSSVSISSGFSVSLFPNVRVGGTVQSKPSEHE